MSNKKPAVTKSELVSELAEKTNLTKNQIKDVFEALENTVADVIKSGASLTIPNLCKIYVHKKPASKAREMRSPATGQMIMVPAKPARKVVKVKAVKNLKEML
jgi:nucleoid DNA-binding protein